MLDDIDHETVIYPPGATILEEGDSTDDVILISEGTAKVVAGASELDLAQVSTGDWIGEVSALAGGRRTATVIAETRVVCHRFTGDAFEEMLDANPAFAEAVMSQAAHRLERRHLLAFLERLLGHLDASIIADFEEATEWINLRAGETLFQRGDTADAGYFLISGRLQEFTPDIDGEMMASRDITRDEIVGEIGLFRDEPRETTVVAGRDSRLVKIDLSDFLLLANRHPAVLVPVVAGLARRRPNPKRVNRQRTISVCVAADVDSRLFTSRLVEEIGRLGTTAHLWAARVDAMLGRAGVAQAPHGAPGDARVAELIHEHELDHTYLVCEAERRASEWTERVARQADWVVAVIDPDADDAAIETIDRFFGAASPRTTRVLVMIHPSGTERPANTRAAVAPWKPDHIVHVRTGSGPDIGRLSRILAGHATALVLGGGGARGFAHIGVWRAAHELGIPIDLVGGSSMGSPLGAGIAVDYPLDQVTEYVSELYAGVIDYTIPVVSLARGEQLTRSIETALGDWDFEDLWRPFFCMSTNITQATEVVHDSGGVARAVRASVSIPGVYPPVAFGDDLHVDGGVLNNLPGDIMRKRHPTATIIGVDVAPPRGPGARGDDPALSVSGWQALRSAASKKRNEHPGIAAMLMRTMITASVRQRKRSVERGDFDLYLDLDLRGIPLLDFDLALQVAPMGYEAAMPRLEAWLSERDED